MIEWLRSFGALSIGSGLLLGLVFIAGAFVFVPRTFLSLGAGSLYGIQVLPLVLVSTTAGSVLAFLMARYFLSARVQSWIDGRPNLRAVADAVDQEGWKAIALLRLASPIPSSVQNYAYGVTRVGLAPYTLATFVFTIPQTVLYLYIGATGRSILLEESSKLGSALLLVGAICLLVTVLLIWRKARALMPAAFKQ
jgi:uncharacterized membrane protein YdjX (TVP38/TMEM64 family)